MVYLSFLINFFKHLLVKLNPIADRKWWFWPIEFLFNLLDVLFIPQLVQLLFFVFKNKSRKLTEFEVSALKKVYGSSINYNKFWVDEYSFFALLGAKYTKQNYLGVVIFNTINFNRTLYCENNVCDTAWLIHEFAHCLQYKKYGSKYIFYCLYAQHTTGYELKNINSKTIYTLNLEQQAEVCKFYYLEPKKEQIVRLKNEFDIIYLV